ncbi:MAG: M1 family metallopeptidase [Methanobacteriota archaeon]|nr:MAG: M1 family metallopeptidase [Euryarchaeota archaeon]
MRTGGRADPKGLPDGRGRTGGLGLAGLWFVAQTAAGQQPGIDVKSYMFFITLPDSGRAIRGDALVNFERRTSTDSVLTLDLVGMTVDSVRIASILREGPRTPFTYDGRVLRIPVPAGPPPFSVVVSYHGAPQDGLIIGPNARGRRGAFADNWPQRARFWLPTVDHPSDKATVTFAVFAPTPWRVVANGRLNRGAWTEARPIPTYTMVLAAGEFAVSRHRALINGRDTVPIDVWTYPEDSAHADSVPFRRVSEITEGLQRIIGPFPYEKLAHVESATRFGGMENSSAIFYAEKPYIERRMREGVVRHETAHQWFGDAVTPRDWHHLWLSEGFASYLNLVVGAALDGDTLLAGGMARNAESYFASDVVDRPIIDTTVTDPMLLLNANNYPKGAWVLHMLRGVTGDSAFFRGLRTYYRTYRDSTATSEDFQQVMEGAAGVELGWFFRQWLRQPGYPQLDVTWQYDAASGRVLLGVTQSQKATWGLFRIPVLTLEFRGADGTVWRRDVLLTGRQAFPRFDIPFAPTEVRVDPGGKLLLRATVTRAAGN